ncbi:MAG: Fe-S cluster assembly protein SufD [Alphaproteobacteria bacterium]
MPDITDPFFRKVTTLPLPEGLGEPGWLSSVRRAGQDRYRKTGLPTSRMETWKFTSLAGLIGQDFVLDSGEQAPVLDVLPVDRMPSVEGYRCVLINGRVSRALSSLEMLPPGVEVLDLASQLHQGDEVLKSLIEEGMIGPEMPMVALNTLFLGMEPGLVLRIADGVLVDKPLHIVSIHAAGTRPVAYHPRLVVIAGAGSRATLLESHLGFEGPSTLSNAVTSISLGEGAILHHYRLHGGSDATHLIEMTEVDVKTGGQYENFSLSLGGKLIRNEVQVLLRGPNAECQLSGAYAVDGRKHVDNTIRVEHDAPHTTSRQNFRGILDDSGHGVFQGKILVARGARQTDGQQLHKALLLSRSAEVDCKPELEIYTDEVKCSHGATAGEMDEEALFFLRSRGLDADSARALLIEAYLNDVIEDIRVASVREAYKALVSDWLSRRRAISGSVREGVE